MRNLEESFDIPACGSPSKEPIPLKSILLYPNDKIPSQLKQIYPANGSAEKKITFLTQEN